MKQWFRSDDYGPKFYLETAAERSLVDYRVGEYSANGLDFSVTEQEQDGVLTIALAVSAKTPVAAKRFGFRLGIDCYMDRYPDWNDKFFPTALRCEQEAFWGVFMSPLGKLLAVCSPRGIVSWKNEYNKLDNGDVGHRIYTASVELLNTLPLPARHPKSPEAIGPQPLTATLYYAAPESLEEAYAFIERYAGVHVPRVNKFTLEQGEELLIDGVPYAGQLQKGLNTIRQPGWAELTVYRRGDWLSYLDAARQSAEVCQQHPGTHCESWYGFFSRVEHAKLMGDDALTAAVCRDFDAIFLAQAEETSEGWRMREETLPHRLQNTSSMLSLLADFYELTGDEKYLTWADGLADWLMSLQVEDGSYRNWGIHYTCVIYPAKSMLELALAEQAAGLTQRYETHFASAYRAITDLSIRLDNIGTEGEMTFEDGMISCESLQLGFLATLLPEGEEKAKFTAAAAHVLKKHLCLEQQILPDCRTRGCTLRYWEARYDLNFFENALNCPHGWTSWKTYATYYLYLLTGDVAYLANTMDTLGASVQCVDAAGELHWGYIADPCVEGLNLVKGCTPQTVAFEPVVVGEQYLPMLSTWYRQAPDALILQYQESCTDSAKWEELYGGTCDNDVHEHFKCLAETVLGKAFIHETATGTVTYNCHPVEGGFASEERSLRQLVLYADAMTAVIFGGKTYAVKPGFNFIAL